MLGNLIRFKFETDANLNLKFGNNWVGRGNVFSNTWKGQNVNCSFGDRRLFVTLVLSEKREVIC